MKFKQVSYDFLCRVPVKNIKFLACEEGEIDRYTDKWYWFSLNVLNRYKDMPHLLYITRMDYERVTCKLERLFYEQ